MHVCGLQGIDHKGVSWHKLGADCNISRCWSSFSHWRILHTRFVCNIWCNFHLLGEWYAMPYVSTHMLHS